MSKTRRNWYLLAGWFGAVLMMIVIKGFVDPCSFATEKLKNIQDDRKGMEQRFDYIGLRANDPKLWQAEEAVQKSCPQRP